MIDHMSIIKSSRAPGGYLLCAVWGSPGHWVWDERDDRRTWLIHADYELPHLATRWGFVICGLCAVATDGTVPCRHKDVSEMIVEAQEYIECNCIGEVVDDPGFFTHTEEPNDA